MILPNDKELKKIWAEVPADYYFNLSYVQRLWHDWKWLVIKHLIQLESAKPRKVLEVGCSSGHLSNLLAEFLPSVKIYGIDVFEQAVREAKRRFRNIHFQVADAHHLPFSDDTFDLIICSETIEHVVDPQQVLHEIARVLTARGVAIIEMDSGSPLFRIVWALWTRFGKGRVWRHAHLYPFTAVELDKLIQSNGFEVRKKIFSHFGMAVSFMVSKNQVFKDT